MHACIIACMPLLPQVMISCWHVCSVREAFDWHTPPLSVFRRHISCSWHLQATSSTLLHAMVTRESLRDVARWPHVGHVPNDFRSAARDRGQVRGVHCGRTSEGHTHAHVHAASLTRVARCSWTSLAPRSNARQIRQRCLHQTTSSSGLIQRALGVAVGAAEALWDTRMFSTSPDKFPPLAPTP
jgi:hypothetical protein